MSDFISSADERSKALDEALRQIEKCVVEEEDRRKTADLKLTNAQGAVGFTITLASGALFAGSKLDSKDPLHLIIIGCVFIALIFFGWASWWVVKGLDPSGFQKLMIDDITQGVINHASAEEMKQHAIGMHRRNTAVNIEATNLRLTAYRAASENIFKGVVFIGLAPLIIVCALTIAFFQSYVNSAHTEIKVQNKIVKVILRRHVLINKPALWRKSDRPFKAMYLRRTI